MLNCHSERSEESIFVSRGINSYFELWNSIVIDIPLFLKTGLPGTWRGCLT